MNAKEYSAIDRFLHKLALGSDIVRRTSLELELLTNKYSYNDSSLDSPVYILGLARAGTTILLDALYSTGLFASLTYRNMPFVLAPRLWSRFTARHHKVSNLAERKHGDSLKVGYDSPEAFEEVFWLTFSKEEYLKSDRLIRYSVDNDILDIYKKYVSDFLSIKYNRGCRYIAKNNNNILRISSLLNVFPNGCYIVPFRNPVAHAESLLRQQQRFRKLHSQDEFSLKYMNWLGHFEFGLNFKPICLDDEIIPENENELYSVQYWLLYWTSVYESLLKKHGDDVIFFDFDSFCENPEKSFEVLASAISIDPNLLYSYKDKIKAANNKKNVNIPYRKTQDVYNKLLTKSLQQRNR